MVGTCSLFRSSTSRRSSRARPPADALRNSLDLAQHAERWGYHRFWLAEHHNAAGIASAATAVVIAHVAAGTTTIRVGAGGIMLPEPLAARDRRAVRHARGAPSRAASTSASAVRRAPTS